MLKVEPVITEKSMNLAKNQGVYTFKAPVRTTKDDIKRFFKEIYGYTVVRVRSVTIPPKIKQNLLTRKKYVKKGYKKFYIEFAEKVEFAKFNIK